MTAKILEANFQRSGHFRRQHEAIMKEGQTLDDALAPAFWANVAKHMRQFDKIALMPEDGSFYAEMIVLTAGTGFAKVATLFSLDMGEEEEVSDVDKSVIVKWRGPQAKFSVVRTTDKSVLQDGFDDKADAERFMRDYLKRIAA